MTYLDQADRALFLWLNGLHAPYLDQAMFLISGKLIWLPFYLWMIYLVFKAYPRKTVHILILLALCVALSDQIASHLLKNTIQRLRPSHEPALKGLVHLVNDYRGGQYGFVSSHAANSFGLALFLFLVLRKSFPWIARILFPWAMVVSYSRIYLGVHYPGDILGGAIVGLASAYGLASLFRYIDRKNWPGMRRNRLARPRDPALE